MQANSIFILGRQPAIGRAELESVLGAAHVHPLGDTAVMSDIPAATINFDRLGSSVKLATYLDTVQSTQWRDIQDALIPLARTLADDIFEGKIQLGLSAYGVRTNPKQLMAAGLTIKKELRKNGFSVRLTPNTELELSSAQVLHNHLAGERGIEFILIKHGTHTVVARTVATQDITAYAKRDQGRPKRDAFVGMLPPKLAQTIINLGVGGTTPDTETVVLDPFCGTGVLLQEALLMGFGAYGTDLEPRMIDYSQANLQWLSELHDTVVDTPLEVGDATNHHWNHPFTAVACETYLGHPLANFPRPEKLQQIIGTCNVIIEKFMQNIGTQMPAGSRLCLAVPAWINPNGKIHHLPLLDHLEKMGYNRVSFVHSREVDMVYHRSDQIVARELLVITRK
jgi:tRNA G10  N-methylase Trm11